MVLIQLIYQVRPEFYMLIVMTLYNMLEQKVRTFNYQNTSPGYHSVKWNATNDYGDPAGAGIYLYQLQTKECVKTRKIVLLK